MNQLSLRNTTVDAHIIVGSTEISLGRRITSIGGAGGKIILKFLLLGGKGIFVWGIFARLPHLGFFLQGFSSKSASCARTDTKTTMETSRANAKEAILSLLLSFPDDVRCTYYTVDELVRILMRGGVSPSLEISLVRSSLQHVPNTTRGQHPTTTSRENIRP